MRPAMLRITPEMEEILQRIAAEKDWTLARVMRMLLADGLRSYLIEEARSEQEVEESGPVPDFAAWNEANEKNETEGDTSV